MNEPRQMGFTHSMPCAALKRLAQRIDADCVSLADLDTVW